MKDDKFKYSKEVQDRIDAGLSVEGMGMTGDPDEGLDLTMLDEMIRQTIMDRVAASEKFDGK